MRYGRFTDGIYCADGITTQLAGPGIPDSQSMALGEIGSNGRFINIKRVARESRTFGEVAGAGEVQGANVGALVAPWR